MNLRFISVSPPWHTCAPLLRGPSSLAAALPSPQQAWVTGGPVTRVSGPYALVRPLIAYAVTSAAQQQQAQSGSSRCRSVRWPPRPQAGRLSTR